MLKFWYLSALVFVPSGNNDSGRKLLIKKKNECNKYESYKFRTINKNIELNNTKKYVKS
jgi:hypothetical protein